jgi:hypothetical protein
MAMANHVYNGQAPPLIPTNLSITQNPLPAGGPGVALDTLINVRAAQWPEVKTGGIFPAGAHPGIFTIGQFQCMAVCLAIIPNPGAGWTQCNLAHVSHKDHGKVTDIANLLNAGNHANDYVVIGGRASMNDSMDYIRGRLMDLPNPPVHVWIYSVPDQANFGFGIRSDGHFGQITY